MIYFPSSNPHDAYFQLVFKVLPVAKQLIRAFLPYEQLAEIDLNTLQVSSDSFVSKEMREHFADLVYSCLDKKDKKIRLCLLFEHKSTSEGRSVYGQIGGYLFGIQAEDIRQKRNRFTLTIPVLFYHGEERWNVPPLREQYGDVPKSLSTYIPHFDILYINLREISDDAIRSMKHAMLLRNVLLVFKHVREQEFLKKNFPEVVIFADENEDEELLTYLFDITLFYVQSVSPFNPTDAMKIAETLPGQYGQRAISTFEQFIDIGIEKGMEKLLLSFIRKNPKMGDAAIAELFDVPITFVKKVRTSAEDAS